MTLALDRPTPAAVFSQWTVQPLAILVVVLLAVSYARAVHRLERPWPRRRTVVFGLGLAALMWTTCGFPQVYARSLYWVWTTQTLVLWLAVPIIVLWGRPVQLARAVAGPRSRLEAVLRTRAVRIVSNPLVGPALVPLLSGALFFGPLPRWAISSAPAGWVLHLILLVVGALMVLPLVGLDEDASSLAVGFSLAIGSFELVLDAFPGVVLRLKNNLATSWFDARTVHDWTPVAIHDQRVAGAILWCVAEIIDLPFLFLVYRRWLRADARDAARVDAVLEAERAARRGYLPEDEVERAEAAAEPERDAPWWLSDPTMQQRLRRPE